MVYVAGALGIAVLSVIGWSAFRPNDADVVFEPPARQIEPAPFCPWREPQQDLETFFRGATQSRSETRVLSSQLLILQKRLGRPPNPEELSLSIQRVLQVDHVMGSIMTRRVKGENGAIEIVVAVNPDQTVHGIRVQRIREPESIARSVQNPIWLGAFEHKDASSRFELGRDIPEVPDAARASAQAIIDGVRSLLILSSIAEGEGKLAHVH